MRLRADSIRPYKQNGIILLCFLNYRVDNRNTKSSIKHLQIDRCF